jgi:hypothetical protein
VRPLLEAPEIQDALELRFYCYHQRGKLSFNAQADSLEQELKRPGQLYGVFYRRQVVGSFRMHAPGPASSVEMAEGVLGFYPQDFPAKQDLMEINHLCLLLPHRNFEVFLKIYAEVHSFLVKNSRSWILIGADQKLAPKYRFIGFSPSGYSYEKKDSRYPYIQLMLSNQKVFGTYGLNADPIRWNLFLKDVTDELVREGWVRHNRGQKIIFGAYRLFAPFAYLLAMAAKMGALRV